MVELARNVSSAEARRHPVGAAAAACANSGRQPSTDSALGRVHGEIRAGQMQLRAAPRRRPAQCAAVGRRGRTPSRKVMIAAGRPGQRGQRPRRARFFDRLRAVDAARRPDAPSGRGRRADRPRPRASRTASGCRCPAWCARRKLSSPRPRRCPCRTAVRRCRSASRNAASSSAETSV